DPISASIGSTLRIAANPGAHVPARAVIAKVGLDKDQQALVANWIWYTTYLEAFGGSTSESMISKVTDGLRKAV
ncbi:MAG: hypothetical protein MUF54_25300, partial [Polyangiaceae bacterium]|nr:hypothetical protein [Polyangiaceae bacterium]